MLPNIALPLTHGQELQRSWSVVELSIKWSLCGWVTPLYRQLAHQPGRQSSPMSECNAKRGTRLSFFESVSADSAWPSMHAASATTLHPPHHFLSLPSGLSRKAHWYLKEETCFTPYGWLWEDSLFRYFIKCSAVLSTYGVFTFIEPNFQNLHNLLSKNLQWGFPFKRFIFWSILEHFWTFRTDFAKPYSNMNPFRKNSTTFIYHRYFTYVLVNSQQFM